MAGLSLISSQSREYVRNLLDALSQAIVLALQRGGRGRKAVENLEKCISGHVVHALGEVILPRTIEAELLALRSLFQSGVMEAGDQELDRLQHAQIILNRIASLVGYDLKKRTIPSFHAPKESIQFSQPIHSCETSRERETPTSSVKQSFHEISIRFAKGVGPKRAFLLEKLGIRTIEDALWVLPWRYEDRSVITPIREVAAGQKATVSGIIDRTTLRRLPRRNMIIVSVIVRDESGWIEAVFFNQPYLEKTFQRGMHVILSGPVTVGPGKNWSHLQLRTPHYELVGSDDDLLLHVGRIVPVYHETKGLTSRHLRRIVHGLLDEHGAQLPEILPPSIRQRYQWPVIEQAMQAVHFPSQSSDLEELNAWSTPAHRRLAFEECFVLQIALAVRQQTNQIEKPGIAFTPTRSLMEQLHAKLPFPLTSAQKRVIEEIRHDMMQPHPMNRLIQGDVGSGKTLVALHAMLLACESGYQGVLMVPTEILAEQHYKNIMKYLEGLGVKGGLVTGGLSNKQRVETFDQVSSGEVQLVVGTHALLEETVRFKKLGLVVIDEQHKFGVLQRAGLQSKGLHPDVLVMTATPIPRTLAMTTYGDLDVSVIDEMPAGRKPIQTTLYTQRSRSRAYSLIRRQLEAGRQAYIVYPLVEESEKTDLEAAMQAAERLQNEEFPAYHVGLLHGRMKSEEKIRIMEAFKEGSVQVLVATTVIEVGMDVPNATVMAIEHADRFGLAQLHQLRGRVGRGEHQSFCLLIRSSRRSEGTADSDPNVVPQPSKTMTYSPELPLGRQHGWGERPAASITHTAQQRLRAMVNCADGFAIAEQDLRIRGPGEFLGTRQWGMPEFRVADLVRDSHLLEQARQEAFQLVQRDPHLALPEHQHLKATMLRRWKSKLDLGSVG